MICDFTGLTRPYLRAIRVDPRIATSFNGSNFKGFYVKVRSAEDSSPFFLDKNLWEKFPLYTNSKPVQFLGIDDLCEKDAGLSEFLFEVVSGGKILTTFELVKWERDRDYVVKYLETKVPDCSIAGLKSFFKQKT
ncbi:hypothetical protein PIB30_078984 [Stylosanthes scabra]|uniref:Uncharacterized protein n=1 Tax=Stylosanthes scabra TaxID=79078 RepID=A0ABU6YRC7_9FABA|nr:hypothetical protein [Stylosanthes scabra]